MDVFKMEKVIYMESTIKLMAQEEIKVLLDNPDGNKETKFLEEVGHYLVIKNE